MRRLLEVAFRPPPPAGNGSSSSGAASSSFAVLRQQTPDELVLSEVHTKLDRALLFLQRDVGYSLLDDARPCPGGGVRLLQQQHPAPRGQRSTRMPKGGPEVKDEEAREIIRVNAGTARYAHYPDDLVLVWRFTSILGEVSPEAAEKVQCEVVYKTILLGIRLMHSCDYDYSDLVVTLAYTSVYFRNIFEAIGHRMSVIEVAHVCVLLVYLAHSFVLDETCPLKWWQKHIFKKYCTLKVLDAALFRLFQMMEFTLRISEEDEREALSVLLCSPNGFDVILSCGEFRTRPPSTSTTATSICEPPPETT